MKNKVLFTITNLDLIPKLKGLGISNFVYPLSFFCVGIPKTFAIEEITEDEAYLFVNRVLDCDAINRLSEILHNLPSNIKGIIFDDLGLIEVLKDVGIEKILYYSHFNTNYASINYFFDYVDEVIVSTDITEEEIDEIIAKANKKVSLFVFGLVPSLYSRRTLLTNHAKQFNLPEEKQKELYINDKKFIGIENEFGMMMYHYPYYDGSRLLNKDVKYLFYYPILLEDEKVLKVAENDFKCVLTDEGFLDTKTIYKVKNN
ncbi:MAG: U32 family peptidase [Bacilli bacterium]|nr:U32 family peptidase [Bacilli bacterium]